MSLIPIEHPTRLRSPVQAEALFRRLGESRVGVRGFRTGDAAMIERLIAAIEPDHDATVSFENGVLDADGWERLDALAAARPGYLELHAGPAHLRAWPAQAKVYAKMPQGGLAAVAAALGTPVRAGENQVGGCTVMIDPVAGYPLAIAVTGELAAALPLLRALGGAAVPRGFVMGAHAAAKAALAPFVRGLGATVHVVLDVSVEAACELASTCRELVHDWQAAMVVVDFPGGRVHGFVATPIGGDDRARWLARVDEALAGSVGPAAV